MEPFGDRVPRANGVAVVEGHRFAPRDRGVVWLYVADDTPTIDALKPMNSPLGLHLG